MAGYYKNDDLFLLIDKKNKQFLIGNKSKDNYYLTSSNQLIDYDEFSNYLVVEAVERYSGYSNKKLFEVLSCDKYDVCVTINLGTEEDEKMVLDPSIKQFLNLLFAKEGSFAAFRSCLGIEYINDNDLKIFESKINKKVREIRECLLRNNKYNDRSYKYVINDSDIDYLKEESSFISEIERNKNRNRMRKSY